MIIITKNIADELANFLLSKKYDKIFILTDDNTFYHCFPIIGDLSALKNAMVITIKAGDIHKDISQVNLIWDMLSNGGASRNSALINLGGGMVTDLGGFAGATFKRGIHNINIPTTLMASVDAAIGGKTGINFNGLKNEIGSFYQPECVIIDCNFLKTLDRSNFLSGYAEILKHALISTKQLYNEVIAYDIDKTDIHEISNIVLASVQVKEQIVREDPTEKSIRKALNFGHTIGHAVESNSFSVGNPLLHGHAVAAGLICELYLSHKICRFPVEILDNVTNYIRDNYPHLYWDKKQYETLYGFMRHDKKNEAGRINFTLLGNIGEIHINQEVSKELIGESLDFYSENSG